MTKKAAKVDLSFLSGNSHAADLSATFQAASSRGLPQARSIALARLNDNPYQPRTYMDEGSVDELAGVIASQGFQGVLVARPDPNLEGYYQLTAGHRRREAAKRAGLTSLPVVVEELADEEMVVLAITENIQREDLTALEEGRIFLLMAGELGYTHEQVAKEVGKSRGYVENRIRIARAPLDVQQMVAQRPDTIRAVATLVKLADDQQRSAAISELVAGRITADDLTSYLATKDAAPAASLGEKRRRPGRPANSAASADAATLERVGSAKLDTALRSLLAYKESLRRRGSMTVAEAGSLAQIGALVEELLTIGAEALNCFRENNYCRSVLLIFKTRLAEDN